MPSLRGGELTLSQLLPRRDETLHSKFQGRHSRFGKRLHGVQEWGGAGLEKVRGIWAFFLPRTEAT